MQPTEVGRNKEDITWERDFTNEPQTKVPAFYQLFGPLLAVNDLISGARQHRTR